MIVGIISDTHDNMPVIKKAVNLFNERKTDIVVHAGDYVSPFTAFVFKELNCPLKGVLGNNDGDPVAINKFYNGIAEIVPGWLSLELEGKKIYVTHQPLPEPPSDCDLYIFGHTHEPLIENRGCLVVNPGECAGWLSDKATVAVADLYMKEAEIIEL